IVVPIGTRWVSWSRKRTVAVDRGTRRGVHEPGRERRQDYHDRALRDEFEAAALRRDRVCNLLEAAHRLAERDAAVQLRVKRFFETAAPVDVPRAIAAI